MPIITNTVNKELLATYDGYDPAKVGIGLMQPDIYKTPNYSKKKIQTLMLGSLSKIIYSGFEHDREPLILPFYVENAYNTVMAFNLRYLPVPLRKAVAKFVLESNVARIKSNLPMIIDYHAVRRAVPEAAYVVRRYKQVGIRVEDTIPLVEWANAIREPSKWQNHYKLFQKTG